MSDEENKAAAPADGEKAETGIMDPNRFKIGYDKGNDPDVMVFSVPLSRCAQDIEEGSALVRGKLEEAKQIALNIIKAKRERANAMKPTILAVK